MSWHSDVLKNSKYSKSHLLYAEENGDAYGNSVRIEDVADDGTINLLLFNPSDSGKNLCWINLEVASEGKAYIDFYGDVTTNVTGTALFQCNKNAGSTRTSVARTEYNGSYIFTSANLIHQSLLPGGTGPQSIGGEQQMLRLL